MGHTPRDRNLEKLEQIEKQMQEIQRELDNINLPINVGIDQFLQLNLKKNINEAMENIQDMIEQIHDLRQQ